MSKIIKKVLIVFSILVVLITMFTFVNATTIEETTKTIAEKTIIIGVTKFTPETSITAAKAAKAGANDYKIYMAQNKDPEKYTDPVIYYYVGDDIWFTIDEDGEATPIDAINTLDIYYVDNEPKMEIPEVAALLEESVESNKVSYTFMNDTTVVDVGTVTKGDKVTVPAAPTKEHNTFKGWFYTDEEGKLGEKVEPGSTITVSEDTVIVAVWEIDKFTIKFVNEDGTELQVTNVAYGATPSYDGAQPTKAATAQYTYTFAGWDSEVVAVTGAKTYTATYTSKINEYLVTFTNDDDSFLSSMYVAYGIVPTYPGTTPVKTATVEFTYTFASWTPELDAVTGDAIYKATYTQTTNEYAIKFENEDGTELQSTNVAYGTTPEYTGATPTKAATAQYTYTFAGWDSEVVAVTGAKTYTATYTIYRNVATLEALNEALLDENIEIINMIADITSEGIVEISRPLTLNLNGNTLARNGGGATLNPYNVAGKVVINGKDSEGNIGKITNLNSQQSRNTTAIWVDNDNNPETGALVEINDIELSGVNYGLNIYGDSNASKVTTEVILNRVNIIAEDNLALNDYGCGINCNANARMTINDSSIDANTGVSTSGGAQGSNIKAFSTINRTKIISELNPNLPPEKDVACCVFGGGNSVTTMNDCNGTEGFTGDVYVVSGNGSANYAGAEFYINNCDLTSHNDVAMYMPGTETLNIIDSKLTGVGGLEACTGTITIAGSIIKGTGESLNIDANQANKGDGCWTDGSAIFIRAQKGYNDGGNLTLTIDDTLSSKNQTTKIESANGNGVRIYENVNNTESSHGVNTVTITGLDNSMFTVNENQFTANLNENNWFTLTLNGSEIESTVELTTIN